MSVETSLYLQPRLRTARAARAAWRLAGAMTLALIFSGAALLLLSPKSVPLAAPLLVNANLALFFVLFLLFTERRVPVFESGSLWVAATLVYASLPFVGFIAAGMQWTATMDNRLQQYPFVEAEIVWFAWQYTMYLAAFIFVYLLVRRRAVVPVAVFNPLHRTTAAALLLVFAGMLAVKWSMFLIFGIDPQASHSAADLLANVARIARVPPIVWQICGHMMDGMLLGQMGVAVILLTQWRRRRWARIVLPLWLAEEIAVVVARDAARARVVLLLLCVVMLYHRLVRPLSLRVVIGGSAALLCGFLLLGLVRFRASGAPLNLRSAVITANEFQTIFATAFDLHQREKFGMLRSVPWQVYVSDLYLEIPHQLLPFEKIDPSVWYLELLGVKDQGIGYMFGVMAQAVLGFGWIEMVVRGAFLGVLYALLHRWYARRALDLWPTLFYAFVSVWSFYSFRATTLWSLHFVVYQFLPFMLVTKLVALALRRPSRAASPV